MIEISTHSKIYIACPSQVATGGPELLHQLAYKMNASGYNVYMLYLDDLTFSRSKTISKINRYQQPVHDFYKKYANGYTKLEDIEDKPENVLIAPETYSGLVYLFKNMKKVIWWLSVDNFFLKQQEKKYKLKKLLFLNKPYRFEQTSDIYHLAQSYYAIDFLKQKGVLESKIGYLSDFLNTAFLDQIDRLKFTAASKKDYILYNPKKGYEITSKLKELLPNYTWKPIMNMTPEEVKSLLLESKIYIDFGFHPGKDRFPREAAICGCCVITGTEGSAKFKEDVYISDRYKFEDPVIAIHEFKKIIQSCLEDYDTVIKDFEEYRNRIANEEKTFEQDIIKNFI